MLIRLIAELRRPRPLLRAAAELARKGYPTIAVFSVGWPTSELPAFYADPEESEPDD